MSVLRVYTPAECDADGVPLDWEQCRECDGVGWFPEEDAGGNQWRETCPVCEGHGSLKRAALDHWRHSVTIPVPYEGDPPITIPREVRCEGCGHPMSDGTWEGRRPPIEAGYDAEGFARNALRRGDEPDFSPLGYGVHYSACDEGCGHGGPVLRFNAYGRDGAASYDELPPIRDGFFASWRQVDVRRLSWPCDLRPEMLAMLCTRCYAERGK
jgi:hypothetical protein